MSQAIKTHMEHSSHSVKQHVVMQTDATKKYEGNNSAQHYIYNVIKHLCDDPKVSGWERV